MGTRPVPVHPVIDGSGTVAGDPPCRGVDARRDLPEAVVFDLDGTLVDTETISGQVLTSVLAELGHEVTGDDLLVVRGRAFAWLREWLEQRFGVTAAQYRQLAGPAWAGLLEQGVPTFDDTMGVLDELSTLGVPMAVCTSSGRGHLDVVLDRVGITDRFAATVSATEVTAFKPDPEPYLLAVSYLGTDPARTVAVEDTAIGASAAVTAGLRVIGRPDPGLVDLSGIAHLQVDRVDMAALQDVLVPA